MTRQQKLLLVRMDKLGDLVLSLPVDQAPIATMADVTWLVSQGTGFIAAAAVPPRRFFEMPKGFSWRNLFTLVRWLRAQNFYAAVVLYAPWWIGLALWIAQVPTRVGRVSQWHSFLFFNRGVRQSRKGGQRHETDDNLTLLQTGLMRPTLNRAEQVHQASVTAVEPLRLKAPSALLQDWSLTAQGYYVVHPGMAGSALNWPTSCYAELIRELIKIKPVVITGTKTDAAHLKPLQENLAAHASSEVIWLNEKLNSAQLLTILMTAQAVIAPSTGVLHLAAALGTPVVGLYSPLPVQRPTRWGPRGQQVVTLVSPATEAEALVDPTRAMGRIRVQDVLQALNQFKVGTSSELSP
ncbi:MAG: glycosyltransferase family 9 protein [Bdellovibrionales bacterium]